MFKNSVKINEEKVIETILRKALSKKYKAMIIITPP